MVLPVLRKLLPMFLAMFAAVQRALPWLVLLACFHDRARARLMDTSGIPWCVLGIWPMFTRFVSEARFLAMSLIS